MSKPDTNPCGLGIRRKRVVTAAMEIFESHRAEIKGARPWRCRCGSAATRILVEPLMTSIIMSEKDTLMVMILHPTPACEAHAKQISAELRRQGGLVDYEKTDVKYMSREYDMSMPAHLLQDFLQMQQTGRVSSTLNEWLQQVK